MQRIGVKILFLGIFLIGLTGRAEAYCGEATCVSPQGSYISHFTGPNCDGTESYYLPYNGYGYQCRPWDGGGQCGTIRRTVTNRSYRYNGQCYPNAWPSGNTLSDFVTVYRTPPPPPPPVPPVACGYMFLAGGMTVAFNASCSYDPDGGPITGYQWSFGDGFFGWWSFEYHTYMFPGWYSVWLTVWDDEGQSSSAYMGTVSVS